MANRRKEPRPRQLREGFPRAPEWFNKEQRDVWRKVVRELRAMSVLTRVDRFSIERYCTLYCRWVETELFLQTHSHYYPVRDRFGNVKELKTAPQVRQARQYNEHLLKIECQFGMTPSSRTRIQLDKALEHEVGRSNDRVVDMLKVRAVAG